MASKTPEDISAWQNISEAALNSKIYHGATFNQKVTRWK
jgi:hypothetical protein